MTAGGDASSAIQAAAKAGGFAWMVVRTNIKCEHRAKAGLIVKGFDVYLPILTRWKTHAGRKHIASFPLFARYIFLGIDRSRQSIYDILSVDGVESLLSVNGKPAVVPNKIVADLKAVETVGLLDRTVNRKTISIKQGQDIRVLDGPFATFPAKVLAAPEGQRVSILLSLFGGKSRAKIDAASIEVI
ncbi:Transcriptional activator RfaH [Hyphomicrobiales bacterium]|nr:Transcriptional activator RfaH [Hyphomicrobiales bacterium]CAH1667767.1 Transcriptional activator RfaH [Hyphomicrobiales bacterium]